MLCVSRWDHFLVFEPANAGHSALLPFSKSENISLLASSRVSFPRAMWPPIQLRGILPKSTLVSFEIDKRTHRKRGAGAENEHPWGRLDWTCLRSSAEAMLEAVEEAPVLFEQTSVERVDEIQHFLDVRVIQLDSFCPLSKWQCSKRYDQRDVTDAHAKRLVQR